MVDAIRDALEARNNNESAPNGRDDERTTRDDDARVRRRGHFPPSHTPGGTRRSFTGVRDLLEDLRAAIDDATLMEQQGSRWTAMDAEIDAGCRAQAASACALVWSALDAFQADTHQHEDQFLAHGGVELLLLTMRTFPLDPRVVSAAAGACLSLARDSPAGRRALERSGGRRAVRAAMCAHPGMNFGGAFAGLRAWLDGEEGVDIGGGRGEGVDVVVGDAAAEAFIRSRTTGDELGGASPNDDDVDGVARDDSRGDDDFDDFNDDGDGDDDGDNDDVDVHGEDENEFDGFGGEWARFDLALARLAKVSRALKVRRLTFQPVLERTRGNLHACALWATVTGVREPPSLRYYVGGGPRSAAAEKKSGKTLELRELIEVTRGVSTTSLLSHAPERGAARCLALRFSSKTVNLVFGTKKERERFAKALGLAAAHVKSLIGCDGVNVAARRHAAVAVMGLDRKDLDGDGPDALPTQLCAAEYELDKSLARGECRVCAPRCDGRFCARQVDEVRVAAGTRRWQSAHSFIARRAAVEERRVKVLAAVLERLKASREEAARAAPPDANGADLIESISGRGKSDRSETELDKSDKSETELAVEAQLATATRRSRHLAVKQKEARGKIPYAGFAAALRRIETPQAKKPAASVHDSSRSVNGEDDGEDDGENDDATGAGPARRSRRAFTREDASALVRAALGGVDSAWTAMRTMEALIEPTDDDAAAARDHLAAEGAVEACAARVKGANVGRGGFENPGGDVFGDDGNVPRDERLSASATLCLAYMFRDAKNAGAFLRHNGSALTSLADTLESLAHSATARRVWLARDAEVKAADARFRADALADKKTRGDETISGTVSGTGSGTEDASSVGELGDDQTTTRRRYRKARLAAAAADKARELADAPAIAPFGTRETASALANLCAGSGGAAVAARDWLARRGGVAVALRLVRELCANGGAPRGDALKPVLVLLRSLSASFGTFGVRDGDGGGGISADSGADFGADLWTDFGADAVADADAARALSDAFRAASAVPGVQSKTTVALMWTSANLARVGGATGRASMRAAGAPSWIARVCSEMSAAEAVAGLSGRAATTELERAAADEADAALAALAAMTNLCAGGDADADADAFRVSNRELVETIRCVAEEDAEGGIRGVAAAASPVRRAANAVGTSLDRAQARALARVKAAIRERDAESRVGAWARVEGRMHVARHL